MKENWQNCQVKAWHFSWWEMSERTHYPMDIFCKIIQIVKDLDFRIGLVLLSSSGPSIVEEIVYLGNMGCSGHEGGYVMKEKTMADQVMNISTV